MVGTRLSHYDIVEEISRGGMGVVYRAVDRRLGREIALKVLPEDLVHDTARRERLLHEARAASALEHPHIAVIHEVGEADGVTFIAMELIRGEKLSQTLERGPLPPARALALTAEVTEALARAHEKQIIHRDIKPANLMVTDDGHIKVIDFGLAKSTAPTSDDATATVDGERTRQGVILGTAAYMAPEQARGARVDHRSDIFALGVTLYEMLTGRPAFRGQSSLDTLQAVLTQPVPPLPSMAGLSDELVPELQRIIAKATAKDPDERFQSMKDLIVDLRAARRRLESSQTFVVPPAIATAPRPASRRVLAIAAVAAIALAGTAAVQWWRTSRASPPAAQPSPHQGVAVLYFENTTGDKTLDWMRTGLTDMIVTGLSQSEDFEVIGTDRLVQILQDLRRTDDRVLAADVVGQIANRAGVDKVLIGSYVKAGDTIRINARLQEPRTGRIIVAERVEGAGEANLFALVDELTRRFKTRLAAASSVVPSLMMKRPGDKPAEEGLDRGLTEVTTSSIDAYRYYAEGLNYHERGLPAPAAPLLEKAIAIDPDFAMAYAKLAVVYNNLVAFDKRDEYAKKALDRSNRLTARERYYIEGFYYSNKPETWGRAIDAYKQGLKLHPEHQSSRHNLALIYQRSERFAESIEQSEELIRRGTSNPTTYENLADAFIESGDVQRARPVAEDFVRRYPENAAGLRMLGASLLAAGALDDAKAAFQKSAAMNPLDVSVRLGLRVVAMLQRRWADVDAISAELEQSPDPFSVFQSLLGQSATAIVHGRRGQALQLLERATRVPGLSRAQRAATRNRMADILWRDGKPAPALAQAELALSDAQGRDAEFWTLQALATAQAALGRTAESGKTLARLEARANLLAGDREKRRAHWTRGRLAFARHDTPTAVEELSQAVKMLPAHGPPIGPPSNHAELLYDAAVALIAAGRDVDAALLLERMQAGHEWPYFPESWARSFYLLGQIYARRGDQAKSRGNYKQFLELWQDGDSERGWVADARKKLGS